MEVVTGSVELGLTRLNAVLAIDECFIEEVVLVLVAVEQIVDGHVADLLASLRALERLQHPELIVIKISDAEMSNVVELGGVPGLLELARQSIEEVRQLLINGEVTDLETVIRLAENSIFTFFDAELVDGLDEEGADHPQHKDCEGKVSLVVLVELYGRMLRVSGAVKEDARR